MYRQKERSRGGIPKLWQMERLEGSHMFYVEPGKKVT